MKSQKTDNEGNASKISAFRLSKPKIVARTTKPKAEKKGKPDSGAQPVGRKKDAETMRSQTEHPLSPSEEVQARIAKRAYELYEQRGCQHGYDLADWFQAAREVLTSKVVEVKEVA